MGHTIFNVSSFRSKWNIDCKCLWICPSAMIADFCLLLLFFYLFKEKITIFSRYVRRSSLNQSDHIFALFCFCCSRLEFKLNTTLWRWIPCRPPLSQLNGQITFIGDCRQSRFFCLKWISFDFDFGQSETRLRWCWNERFACVCACRVSSNSYIGSELLVQRYSEWF